MSRDIQLLVPEFRDKAEELIRLTGDKGFEMRPFYTERDIFDQAKLWRQSRSTVEVRKAADRLDHEGATYLAKVLINVGPQHGRWATNALPGQSWHNWGEAIDCFVQGDEQRAIWSSKHPGYQAYAETAKELGLVAGHFWQRKDSVHVQYRQSGVRAERTWTEIDEAMKERFQPVEV